MTSHDLTLRLRRATAEDCRLFGEWANDPAVRRAAFNSAPSPWADHVAWFGARLSSPDSVLYVVETADGIPVGQVRFDMTTVDAAEVDLSIAVEWRGRGLAVDALRRACDAFRRERAATIVAHIRPENGASLRTFEKAGFQLAGLEPVRSHDAIRMELRRDHTGVRS
jgi:RimJ/RimL family protein N-acetyltransferase